MDVHSPFLYEISPERERFSCCLKNLRHARKKESRNLEYEVFQKKASKETNHRTSSNAYAFTFHKNEMSDD